VVIERASIDEVYLDLSTEAARLLREWSHPPETFVPEAVATLRAVPTLIAGDDQQEMRMAKSDIRDGHAGTDFSKRAVQGEEESKEGTSALIGIIEEELADDSHAAIGELNEEFMEQGRQDYDGDEGESLLMTASDKEGEEGEWSRDSVTLSVGLDAIGRKEEGEADSWFNRPTFLWTVEDKLLLAGALVALQLRKDVLTQLGFTCSAGIAHNKMLAKLSSGMHKPNKQTLVPMTVVPGLMRDLPFSRVQGFGGKLGECVVREFGESVRTMSDLLALPRPSLVRVFGAETTQWIVQRAQGIDHDKVQDRALPVSIGCSKSFRSANTIPANELHAQTEGAVFRWLKELAGELCERVSTDSAMNRRRPRQLHISLSLVDFPKATASNGPRNNIPTEKRVAEWVNQRGLSLSKVGRFPYAGSVGIAAPETALSVAKSALSLVTKAVTEKTEVGAAPVVWGIGYLGLSATQFEQIESGRQSITSFFSAGNVRSSALVSVAKDGEGAGNSRDGPTNTEQQVEIQKVKEEDERKTEQERGNGIKGIVDQEEIDPIGGEREDVVIVSPNKSLTPQPSAVPTSTTVSATSLLPSASNGSGGLTRANFSKYFPDGDFEVFSSLPLSLQSELLNAAMFNTHNHTSSSSTNIGTAHSNGSKKR
jgi:nucleotidyltransferase/DNA polymerase involved in DNA repair